MDNALPLAQAARMAIQRCKKVTGSTFDWNGNHDFGLMWGQVYSQDREMAVQVQSLPDKGYKMNERYFFKKDEKGKWTRQ